VWPDARIYAYASFDHARAYGLEGKAEVPQLARYGVTGYLNYALGRVYFYIENVGGNLYLVAQESEFTPGQYSIPRLFSATARVRF
jgi:hypothetical protein